MIQHQTIRVEHNLVVIVHLLGLKLQQLHLLVVVEVELLEVEIKLAEVEVQVEEVKEMLVHLVALVLPIKVLLVQILMGIICLFMTIWGVKLCAATWNQFMSTLPTLRVGITYSPIPIGGAITLLFVIERIIFGDQSHRRAVNYELVEDSKEAA